MIFTRLLASRKVWARGLEQVRVLLKACESTQINLLFLMSAYMLAIDPHMYVVTGTNVQSVFWGPSSVQSRCYSFEQTQHMYGLLLILHMCSGLCHVLIHHIPLDGTSNLCHKLYVKLTTPSYPSWQMVYHPCLALTTSSHSTSPLLFPCFHQKGKSKDVFTLSR